MSSWQKPGSSGILIRDCVNSMSACSVGVCVGVGVCVVWLCGCVLCVACVRVRCVVV